MKSHVSGFSLGLILAVLAFTFCSTLVIAGESAAEIFPQSTDQMLIASIDDNIIKSDYKNSISPIDILEIILTSREKQNVNSDQATEGLDLDLELVPQTEDFKNEIDKKKAY